MPKRLKALLPTAKATTLGLQLDDEVVTTISDYEMKARYRATPKIGDRA